MKIGSTSAICAAGQSRTTIPVPGCVDRAGTFWVWKLENVRCNWFRFDWPGYCVSHNLCTTCGCSCGANALSACPVRTPTVVCTTCPDGHRGDGLTCTLCTTGEVSTVPVSGSCISSCLSGQYLSNSICVGCPEFSSSPAGSKLITECLCNAGYTGPNGGTCANCSADTYKAGLGPAACSSCPSNSVSAAGSIVDTACQCNAGYTGPNGGTCSQCGVTQYKAETGSASCLSCPSDSVAVAGSIVDTACQCNAGYTGQNGAICSQCGVNQYKAGLGSASCLPCSSNSVSAAGSPACLCNAGYTETSNNTCSECPAGKYKISTGNFTCTDCSIGKYSNTSNGISSDVCLSCPSNSDAAEASDSALDCICNAGFSGVRRGMCTQCPIAKYRAAP